MNDPWDVKSVRQSGQYISCMKLNGSPLLPPVLSSECREEMKKYKFLAEKVEEKIKAFKSYIVDNEVSSYASETEASVFPDSEESYGVAVSNLQINVETIKTESLNHEIEDSFEKLKHTVPNIQESPTSSSVSERFSPQTTSKFVIDLNLSINDRSRTPVDVNNICQTPNDVPERDCDCTNMVDKKALGAYKDEIHPEKLTFSVSINKENISDSTPLHFSEDGPSSLSAKSFTGSLNDLHKASTMTSQVAPLLRQRSYTVLTPSPLLLAHLKVQSACRGVDVNCISMSESLSSISKTKKRRSWDLETAKVKWSSMALELKEKVKEKRLLNKSIDSKTKTKEQNTQTNTSNKSKSLSLDRARRPTSICLSDHEPDNNPRRYRSPVRCSTAKTAKEKKVSSPSKKPVEKDVANKKSITEDDPAIRVRELYEKIQKQQLTQMANLVEKQKREQMLLQQVFEEQNKILYTQLKTICPKSPNAVKEAWAVKDVERGPVSLSQLISQKPGKTRDRPASSTLNETNNYINQCDKVLKQSRDMSDTIKKQQPVSNKKRQVVTPKSLSGTRTRTNSPTSRNPHTSRKLVYDTSGSYDHDCEILTDRTNDTLADLNVTFPSDRSDECPDNTLTNINIETSHSAPLPAACRAPDRNIKSLANQKCTSRNPRSPRSKQFACRPTTDNERAAASKIVAYAKGFLVRRLMKTERVQGTVQTIKDTLILALQLHQDGNGIWGADVDLHRRLIQQITAACYTLHDTFVTSSPAERCAMIAADRSRRIALANRPPLRNIRPTDVMSQSHSGVLQAQPKRSSPYLMSQSNYENFSGERARRYMQSPQRRPWR